MAEKRRDREGVWVECGRGRVRSARERVTGSRGEVRVLYFDMK